MFVKSSQVVIFTAYESSLLSYIRCFFEAQIHEQSLYRKLIPRLNGELDLSFVTLSPLDCLSVGYFLAFVLRNCRELTVYLFLCGIDDHSFGLMMGELSRHAEACPAGALHGVTELNVCTLLKMRCYGYTPKILVAN